MSAGGKARRFGVRTEALDNASRIIDPERESDTPSQLIGMDKIDMDPGNIRAILLDLSDLEHIDESSPNAARQKAQLEEIRGLARSIDSHGLINAIEVYRMGDRFVVATGQRRYLAHRLLGSKMIRASVLLKRPTRLRAQQYVENEQRSDMTLAERIFSLRSVLDEAGLLEANFETKLEHLKKELGLTSVTAYRYLNIFEGPAVLHDAIRDGRVTTRTAAYSICMLPPDEVEAAIEAHVAGESIERQAAPAEGSAPPSGNEGSGVVPVKRAGRPQTAVRLGAVTKPSVVQDIIRAIISDPHIRSSAGTLDVPDIDWNDFKQASQAWSELIKKLEAAAR